MNGHFKSYECPRLWSSRILLLVTIVLTVNLLHPIFSKLRNNLRILRIFLLSAEEASFVTVFLYGFQFHHQIDNQWFQSTNTRTCDTENERNDSYLSPSSPYNSSFNLIVTKRVLEIDEWKIPKKRNSKKCERKEIQRISGYSKPPMAKISIPRRHFIGIRPVKISAERITLYPHGASRGWEIF